MVFLNMFYQVPWCNESEYYCTLGDLTLLISTFQIVISIAVPISIWKYREVNGFTINFQFLYAIAFAFKYLDDRAVDHFDISDTLDSIFEIQQKTKRFVLIMMIITLAITVCYAKYDKFDICWNAGGIVVSLIFALDHLSLDLTARDRWMIGSFMDIIAWITLFKVFVKNKTNITEFYFSFALLDHVLKVLHANYDSFRDQLYGDAGWKLDLLKVLLYCCFAIQCLRDHTKITSEVTNANVLTELSSGSSEPSVCDSPEKCPKKSVYCIENEKNTSNENKHRLLSSSKSI